VVLLPALRCLSTLCLTVLPTVSSLAALSALPTTLASPSALGLLAMS
jgi:hypothetical protein